MKILNKYLVLGLLLLLCIGTVSAVPAYDSNTKYQLHLNGTYNSTSFIDDVGHTFAGSGGSHINNSANASSSILGNGVGWFNGVNGYISTPDSPDLDFGTNSFTIEYRVNNSVLFASSGDEPGYLIRYNVTGGYMFIYNDASNGLTFNFNNGGARALYYLGAANTITNFPANTWVKVAIVGDRGNATMRLYINGNGTAWTQATAINGDLSAASVMNIGGNPGSGRYMQGFMDAIRISNIARYSANYIPLTTEWGGGNANTATNQNQNLTVNLTPKPRYADITQIVNVTLQVTNITSVDAILANVTFNETSVNVNNVFLNTTNIAGGSLTSAYSNTEGWVRGNVSFPNLTSYGGALFDIQFSILDVTNATVPLNFNQTRFYQNNTYVGLVIPFNQSGCITMQNNPISNLSVDKQSGAVPLAITFADKSEGDIHFRNLSRGDGTWHNQTSTFASDIYTYVTAGNYNAILYVTNNKTWVTNSSTVAITANATIIADFTGTPTLGSFPLSVNFVDMSTGDGLYYWSWEFGDTGTSLLRNPSHIYTTNGIYNVKLTIKGSDGTVDTTKNAYINVQSLSFTILHSLGRIPTYVLVTGTVPGEIISITDKTANNFTVSIVKRADGSRGTNQTIYWCAG